MNVDHLNIYMCHTGNALVGWLFCRLNDSSVGWFIWSMMKFKKYFKTFGLVISFISCSCAGGWLGVPLWLVGRSVVAC